ncbi:hypothetical protein AB833_02720 [Chromatiales bacterium (ex Bugula neritina AB1)]|nr:hypothetical protein AB833_02720 [Chromatiales bacterium (ex Bugula neritina AB1)]
MGPIFSVFWLSFLFEIPFGYLFGSNFPDKISNWLLCGWFVENIVLAGKSTSTVITWVGRLVIMYVSQSGLTIAWSSKNSGLIIPSKTRRH